jgi:hypothetical protein
LQAIQAMQRRESRIANRSMVGLGAHYLELAAKDARDRALAKVAWEPIAKLIDTDSTRARFADLHLTDFAGNLSGPSAKPRIRVAPFDFS